MPLIAMKEIMTPLKLIGIKIFKSSTKEYYIKFWNLPKKRFFS